MRTVFFAVLVYLVIVCLVLWNDIKDFIWTHPWYHSFLVATPGIISIFLAFMEMQHSGEANILRNEANTQRERANALQEELDTERNKHLQQIAVNTQQRLSEAKRNAQILKKYQGQRAFVTEGNNSWGAGGAVIADINENNILTLFNPAGYSSSTAWGQAVRCDKIHLVETPKGSCPVQINIIERYGTPTDYGDARGWEERNVKPTPAPMQRGQNVFNAQYRKDGVGILRHMYVYAATDGSQNYTLVTMEDQQELASWYSSKLDIEKKFAIVQVEWADAGYRHNGGGGGGTLNLFIRK
jgi:hypothetical protein